MRAGAGRMLAWVKAVDDEAGAGVSLKGTDTGRRWMREGPGTGRVGGRGAAQGRQEWSRGRAGRGSETGSRTGWERGSGRDAKVGRGGAEGGAERGSGRRTAAATELEGGAGGVSAIAEGAFGEDAAVTVNDCGAGERQAAAAAVDDEGDRVGAGGEAGGDRLAGVRAFVLCLAGEREGEAERRRRGGGCAGNRR